MNGRGATALPEHFEAELAEVFGPDEGYNPLADRAIEIRKSAEEFLQKIKNNYPNRYFILKKLTHSQEFWEIAIQKNYVIINDENYTKKLQSCFEVCLFLIFIR